MTIQFTQVICILCLQIIQL